MKVLVIPDVHLKPWIIETAEQMMDKHSFDNAVFLGDFVDDWGKGGYLDLYNDTFDALEAFLRAYPQSLICYGNHDISYVWQAMESGYSYMARDIVVDRINRLKKLIGPEQLCFIHRVQNVLFSHAGLTKGFLLQHFMDSPPIDALVDAINKMGCAELWEDSSPLWARPGDGYYFYGKGHLQVVGHTPVNRPTYREDHGILLTDCFSTYQNGRSIGTNQYVWVDTVTKDWGEV